MNTPSNRDSRSEAPMLAPICDLAPNSFILSAETVEAYLECRIESKAEPSKPNAFILGLAYTASWGAGPDLSPSQLENIPVGIQEHAIAPGSVIIRAESHPASPFPSDSFQCFNNSVAENVGKGATMHSIAKAVNEQVEESEAVQTAKKIHKQSAKAIAFDAQKARVSRRLLLAMRSKQLTVVCPTTGIVSLLDVPAIPYPANNPQLAKALVWSSPFADLANCRGIAQQGISYLRKLDTQVLAGVLIVLADAYSLFIFQPFDSGAQKNAILRTAGKDYLIDAIIMIENQIHSGNCRFLPTLSLRFDSNLEQFGLEVRMQAYLKQLADAIAKPDKEAWDEKKILPMYPIRPTYTKDIKSGQQKVSFLARQEQARAKKEFAEDKKAGKIAISQLCKQATVTDKLKSLLNSLMSDEGMLLIPSIFIDKVIEKLEFSYLDNANAKQLVAILKKDRRALKLDLSELEASIEEALESEEDEPAPGQEAAIEEDEAEGPALALSSTDSNESSNIEELEDFIQANPSEASEATMCFIERKAEEQGTGELVAPEGLTAWEKILWKKKMLAAGAKKTAIQNTSIPSTAVYVPGEKKAKLGDKE